MEIQRIGSRPSATGPSDWFTGRVRVDPMFDAPEPARVSGAAVTTGMTHLAIQERLDGNAVEWMEKVSDAKYRAPDAPAGT